MRFTSLARSAAATLLPGPFWLSARAAASDIWNMKANCRLLGVLCDRKRAGLDVGASAGVYTVNMLEHVGACIAFEPRPRAAYALRAMAAALSLPIRVEEVAVSDTSAGGHVARVIDDEGLSTIEPKTHWRLSVAVTKRW